MAAGVAAIVPRIIGMIVADMDLGINRIIRVPADVPVMAAGAAAIVQKIIRMIVAGMDRGIILIKCATVAMAGKVLIARMVI